MHEANNISTQHVIQICVGDKQNTAVWATKSVSLATFVKKLTTPTVTSETYAEYLALPVGEQCAIKDVGGFVGGNLKGGSRKKECVANKTLITLDADYADDTFLESVRRVLGGYMHTIYSTHKHNPIQQRYRVVVYPSRVMFPNECEAISRKLAKTIGIEYFDHTCFQPNRLMFWPSVSKDGVFYSEHFEGELLDVVRVLAEYGNGDAWRSVEWPTSQRETRAIFRGVAKQQNPLEKTGLVGAFCNVVSIRDAVEVHLVDVYKAGTIEGRYSFIEGETANGLVIYDELFAYSNHSTDPTCGQCCNAFDLIRVHKFGGLDVEVKDDTPTNRKPSFQAMCSWAEELDAVRLFRVKATAALFNELSSGGEGDVNNSNGDPVDTDNDEAWLAQLETTRKGVVQLTLVNAILIVRHDPELNKLMAYNQLALNMEAVKTGGMWSDLDSVRVRELIGLKYKVDFPPAKIEDAIKYQAEANSYHPVKAYLEGLPVWDGVQRCATMFVDWLAVKDTEYTRAVATCWLVAAVKRVFEPGAKFDNAPVIYGKQGIGKTMFVQALAGAWYGELYSFEPQLSVEAMSGKWILEINELSANSRSDMELQKAFLSGVSTKIRMAYAHYSTEFKRQCVFIGTTNQSEYLKDSTGNRRWWPIDSTLVDRIDLEGFRAVVGQIWAEALAMYREGVSVFMVDTVIKMAELEQSSKCIEDDWTGVVTAWLALPASVGRYEMLGSDFNPLNEVRAKVCTIEIWEDCLKKGKTELRQKDRLRIGAIMDAAIEFERGTSLRFGSRFGRQRGWERVDI